MSSPESNKTESKEKKIHPTNDEKKDDLESENIHSANKWESVDLGNDGRKKKFLRLMGASKKEHHGRFVIGEDHVQQQQHDRDSPDDEIDDKLEDQFKQSLEHKLLAGPKAHIGLGFHEELKKISDSGDSESKEQDKDEKSDDKVAEKHKLDENSESEAPVKKKMMCNFVKASDS